MTKEVQAPLPRKTRKFERKMTGAALEVEVLSKFVSTAMLNKELYQKTFISMHF
jgi:hypothetical protein